MKIRYVAGPVLIVGVIAFGLGWRHLNAQADSKASAAADDAPTATVNGDTVVFRDPPNGLPTAHAEAANSVPLLLPGRLVWDEDHTVRVYSPFAGRVMRVLVRAGDTVKVGEPLAELASADFNQAQAEANKAHADLTLAQQSAARAADLNRVGVVALKDLEQSNADLARAKVELDRTQTRLRQVDAGAGRNFVLKAPLAGTIVERTVNPGQELRADQSGQPIVVITNPDHLWVWLDAPETAISALPASTVNTHLDLATAAYPTEKFSGHVMHIADAVDPLSRTLKLLGAVDNSDHRLKAEMYVSVSLPPTANDIAPAAVGIPATAAYLMHGHRYAFIQDGPKQFSRIEVTVVREQADQLTVTGLPLNGQIVIDGALYLQQYLDDALTVPQRGESTADSADGAPGAHS